MAVLELKNITKTFNNVTPLSNLNLTVEQGTIFGFLGQNGAGKTTTLRLITGLAKPTSGEIWIQGEKVKWGQGQTNRHIGFLPDVPEFYQYMTPREYLTLCGGLFLMEDGVLKKRVEEMLHFVGLDGLKKSRRIAGFSRGMKQRLGIAQALIHQPKLLLLDEPTSALDPAGRKEILDIILSLKGELTVMFSTHILTDVERICDQIGVLHGGKLALEGNIASIQQQYPTQKILLGVDGNHQNPGFEQGLRELEPIDKVTTDSMGRYRITCHDKDGCMAMIPRYLVEKGASLHYFEPLEASLEDVFLEVIQG